MERRRRKLKAAQTGVNDRTTGAGDESGYNGLIKTNRRPAEMKLLVGQCAEISGLLSQFCSVRSIAKRAIYCNSYLFRHSSESLRKVEIRKTYFFQARRDLRSIT